jgi:sirohydrochlorin ferrochelatase
MAAIDWNKANFLWNDNPHLWNRVVDEVIDEIVSGGKNWKKRDKDKKKRREVIRLLMWRKGIKVYDEKKEVENIELHIDDIKLMAEELKKNVQIIHG